MAQIVTTGADNKQQDANGARFVTRGSSVTGYDKCEVVVRPIEKEREKKLSTRGKDQLSHEPLGH